MKYTFLITILIITAASQAMASNYELKDINIVPVEVQDKLAAAEIITSFQLLDHLITPEQRKTFAATHAVQQEDVSKLANMLELMQIDGIGPKAATLLMLSNVKSLKQLSQSAPPQLLEILIQTNTKLTITGVQPDIANVKDWIDKAANKNLKHLK